VRSYFFRAYRFIGNQVLFGIVLLALLAGSLYPGEAHSVTYARDDLFSVTFPTEGDGWACGRRGTILHTSDGGVTWDRQKSDTKYTLTSICFVDSLHGWAVGDGATILHTEDGGHNWVKQESAAYYKEDLTPEYLRSREFSDMGKTWMQMEHAEPFFLMGVCFVDQQRGWIVTERTTILYTEDGGKTWQTQFTAGDFILVSVSFCDESNGWAVGEFGHIYHTADGGRNWQKQAGEYYLSEETDLIVGKNFLFGVFAVNPRTAWVVGIDGYMARTIDGGKNWEEMEVGVPKTHLFGIASDRRGSVLIGGNNLLMTSSDSGESFKAVKAEPPVTYGWISYIAPRGEKGFVAVGRQGWIYLSDPEGRVWQRAESE
jgi:photosystem II stability/assembly factor-like uncharacterized protein